MISVVVFASLLDLEPPSAAFERRLGRSIDVGSFDFSGQPSRFRRLGADADEKLSAQVLVIPLLLLSAFRHGQAGSSLAAVGMSMLTSSER